MTPTHRVVPAAEGVWSIQTTANGMTVNAFVVRSGAEVALIDTGFPARAGDTREGLSELGLTCGQVDRVLYTHSHPDHMGGGVALGDALGGDHVFWEGTTPARTNYHAYFDALPRWRDWLAEVLPVGPVRDAVMANFTGDSGAARLGTGVLPRQRPAPFGAIVSVGDLRFECLDARGHDPFHAAWYEPERRWLFSGDVVLRVPTPILPVLRDDLAGYRATLDRLESLPVDTLFAGHGSPRADFAAAVATSKGYVRRWYDIATDGLRRGPLDVSQLVAEAAGGGPAALRRAFVVLGSVVSQLEELRARGLAARRADRLWEASGDLPGYEDFVGG